MMKDSVCVNLSRLLCLLASISLGKTFFTFLSSLDFHLVNQSLPWDYNFRFVIEEINTINDKAQVTFIMISDVFRREGYIT